MFVRYAAFPIYPVILAALIVLGTFRGALGVFHIMDALRPTLVVCTIAGATTIVLSRLLRNRDRAALLVGVALLLLFTDTSSRSFVFVSVILLTGCFLLLVSGLVDSRLTVVANTLSLALLVPPVFEITAYAVEWRGRELKLASVFDSLANGGLSTALPNIVHVVLDGYSDERVLRDVYHFDNREFLEGIENLGFQVASDARAPYNQTLFVMSSVFSGEYVTEAAAGVHEFDAGALRRELGSVSTSGPVHGLLRRLDYQMLATESGYEFLSQHADGTVVIGSDSSWFRPSLLEDALLFRRPRVIRVILDALGLGERSSVSLILNAVEHRAYVAASTPFFLFEHILAPHPPFNVDENGTPTERWREHFSDISDGDHATLGEPHLRRRYREGYVAKLRFINSRLMAQLRDMVEAVPSPKIIIVHGDHGGGSNLLQNDPFGTCHMERMRPLFAVYSDDAAIRRAFESIGARRFNLINTYRVIFDRYYDNEIGILDNRSYFTLWDAPQEMELLEEGQLSSPCADSGR